MNASLKVFRTMQAIVACGLLISFFISPSAVSARGGFKGGGGHGGGGRPGGGGGGGGFGGGGGGMGGQAMTRPSTPGLGGSRPNFPSGGGAGGPGFTRPTPSSPSISRPQISRPSGGVKPSTRPAGPPAGSLTRPGSRPELGRGTTRFIASRPAQSPHHAADSRIAPSQHPSQFPWTRWRYRQ